MRKVSAAQTLQQQFGGYGARRAVIVEVLSRLDVHDPVDLTLWDDAQVRRLVKTFVEVRFPTVLVFNKIDKKESSRWLGPLTERFADQRVVLCSAAAETYLRHLVKKGHIRYTPGDADVVTEGEGLKPMDDAQKAQVQSIRDLILFRFGSTGVVEAINAAVELANVIPVYPVRSIHNFGAGNAQEGCFRDVMVVRKGTTFGEVAELISGCELEFIECAQTGQRVADEAEITEETNVCRFVFRETERKKAADDDD